MDLMLYDWVRRSRELVLAFCATLPDDVYHAPFPGFGTASIHTLHAHVADCYLGWLGEFAMGEEVPAPDDDVDVAAMRRLFARVDDTMARFLERFQSTPDERITRPVTWQREPFTVTPRYLFGHTVTHEFHHKGQIVKLARLLGHPLTPYSDLFVPAETDSHRLALVDGSAPMTLTREETAAAVALATAPAVVQSELDQRLTGGTREMWGLRMATAAAAEVEVLPDLMRPALVTAFHRLAAEAEIHHGPGSIRRLDFPALGGTWCVFYALTEDAGAPRGLLVTSREKAVD